ncbi:MAG: hypothetical protein ABEJ67_06205 [Halanaeroarchaeum sp.]
MARPVLAVAMVVALVLVPLTGCVLTGADDTTTTTSPGYEQPDPPESLTTAAAERVALAAEAARLADRLGERDDVIAFTVNPSTVGPTARAHRLGQAVYVSVTYPYAITRSAGRAEAVSHASYVVTTEAIRRYDHDRRVRRVEPFAGGETVADPLSVRLLDLANGSAPIAVSLTYLDAPTTAFVGTYRVGPEGLTVRGVASRGGRYRVTTTSNGSVATETVTLSSAVTAPVVVLREPDGSLTVFRPTG